MKRIVILEDNRNRIAEMRRALETVQGVECVLFDNAPDAICWLRENAASVSLISLDHDLDPLFQRNGEPAEPGDGRDVAKFLATQPPVCTVILHSTNSEMFREMESMLSPAGWKRVRVVPFGGMAWIGSTWLAEVQKKLGL